jgi:DNA topoisomerase-1
MPTDIGMVVTDFLMKYFDRVLDYQFTAKIEEEFDVIAEGKLERHKMIRKFYEPFHTQVVHVGDTAQRESGERVLGKDPKT